MTDIDFIKASLTRIERNIGKVNDTINGTDAYPGLKLLIEKNSGRLNILERDDKWRKWMNRTIIAGCLVIIFTEIFSNICSVIG